MSEDSNPFPVMKKTILSFIQDQRFKIPPVIQVDLKGQTVIVVGANTGLGFETAKHFSRMGPAKLILACRNEEKGRAAVNKIREETGYSAELRALDLARFSSVLSFVDDFLKEGNRLDILVANAAITATEYKTTVDGWEETLQVNDLSTSLLCLLLAPRIVETATKYGTRPRIVVVTSELHYWAHLDDTKVINAPSPFQILNKLLKDTPVTVSCVNPGLCKSDLRRSFSGIRSIMINLLEKALARTAEEGSRQFVWAAVGGPDDVDLLKGAYVNIYEVEEPSDYVLGEEGKRRQDKLWADLIEELSKVDGRVKQIVQNFSG
ncbi:hypothetical protein H1R20_g3738, partial [Candolleomyces eurysporus]